MEAGLVQRANVPFTTIPAAPVAGINPLRLPANLWTCLRGVRAAGRIVADFRPDVLLLTGGFVGAPMAVAARRLPTLLYVPDIEPGMALKFLARFADCIALTTEESRNYFSTKKRLEVTGYPLRQELGNWTRESARQRLDLQANEPVLLVFGGSKGARSINKAVLAGLPQLLALAQVMHISGELDWAEVRTAGDRLPADLSNRYHAHPYLHEEMGAALAAADLVVSRAGASSLGEFPWFGLPAVVVPYPYAWRYQKVNADYLVQRGGALMLRNEDLGEQLVPTLQKLLPDTERLDEMRKAMRKMSRPQAARSIAALLVELAGGGSW
jgi:UDP-N-acetylglucosamine--N-acetylmuramyl-(pentapeptide) pyrophosphoryl-undecaprenol N-acetylglucosamine transferase